MAKPKLSHKDDVIIVDDKTGIKVEGLVFYVDIVETIIISNNQRLSVDSENLMGKTIFGSCTVQKV